MPAAHHAVTTAPTAPTARRPRAGGGRAGSTAVRGDVVSVGVRPDRDSNVQHDLHLRAPSLVLTVGPAASGKSTLLRALVADGVVDLVVSTDQVRAELGLPAAETDTTYATARAQVTEALRAGRVVAVDATNVRTSDRAAWLRVASDAGGASVVALRVGVGLDVEQLLVRDAGRDRHVPAAVIAEQLVLAARSGPEVLAAEGLVVADPRRTRLVRCTTCPDLGTLQVA